MDFIIFLAIIFVPIGFIVKISDINDKVDKDKELTNSEKLILNVAQGFMNILIFIVKSVLGFVIPVFLIALPCIYTLVAIAVSVSNDLIPVAIIGAFIIATVMYLFMVIVITLGNRKAKKAKEKEIELKNENYNNE